MDEKSRYRQLFEDSLFPTFVTDFDGHIIEANRQASQLSGYASKKLLGMTIQDLHQVDAQVLGDDFENLLQGELLSYESALQTKDKTEQAVEVSVQQINISGISHLQWILCDNTGRRKLDSLRQDLIATIYHDLRSPLANVIQALDVLKALLQENENPEVKSILNIAVRSTERVQRLTNSLLDVSRLEAGEPIFNIRPVSPVEIVQEAIEAVLPTAATHNHQIKIAVPKNMPKVLADADMIVRVLINLLDNAIKFTPSKGNISLGAKQDGDWLRLWVADTGRGIAPEDRNRIFEKFTRLEAAKSDTPKGLGLGLAFTKIAIEGHGGEIWVESKLGKGARFNFKLPVAKE